MRFYTNVQMVGDNFLVRGYEDGKHFATREKFYPTLFVDSKRKTKYKTPVSYTHLTLPTNREV